MSNSRQRIRGWAGEPTVVELLISLVVALAVVLLAFWVLSQQSESLSPLLFVVVVIVGVAVLLGMTRIMTGRRR